MKMIAIVSAFLISAGHGRRGQSSVESSKSQLAELLAALYMYPTDAFNPSSPAVSRRDLLARAAAGLGSLSVAQVANAKEGQFSRLDVFSPGYSDTASMPYFQGDPKAGNEEQATYGYEVSEGAPIAKGFRKDVKDEKRAFSISEKIFLALEGNVDKANWFIVNGDLREQAQSMRTSMKSITQYGATNTAAAKKAYDAFWSQISKLDGACKQKDPTRAKQQFGKAVLLLDAWKKVAL